MTGGKPPHRFPIRVYYEDTDFTCVVYHASYLRFLERGRTELLRAAGIGQGALLGHPSGLYFAVRRITIDYLRPARMDDLLTVETQVVRMGGASFDMTQRILRGEVLLLTADVLVATLAGGRPLRIPADMRAALAGEARP